MQSAGVSVRAILDATYVCVGFNIIARIADALGFQVPSEQRFLRAARILRVFGYRRLSGFWISGSNNRATYPTVSPGSSTTDVCSKAPRLQDPYARKLERLRYAVVSGPGSLPSKIRQDISEGAHLSGPMGAFVRKVAAQAFTINDDDIAELHRAHYTDDQIFEAAVSAALGAGLMRLERVFSFLREDHRAETLSVN
jgi:hypothetical protein